MTLQKPKPKSILVYFTSTALVLLLIVVLFNSHAIQQQYRSYATAKTGGELLNINNLLFQAVRHYGFERGRVNVVLNFQGPSEKVAKSIDFLRQHREKGDSALLEALDLLRASSLFHDLQLIDRIEQNFDQIRQLRENYQAAFLVRFSERDPALDDLWFNRMSQQIDLINQLLFTLMHKMQWLPEHRPVAEALYLLSRLRDNTGPVVSYLKAASFHRQSLTSERVHEIFRRRVTSEEAKSKLAIVSQQSVSPEVHALVEAFGQFYFNEYYPQAEKYLEDFHADRQQAALEKDYLAQGVKALEMLNEISKEIELYYSLTTPKVVEEEKIKTAISLISSVLTLSIILYILYLIYSIVYKRIMQSYRFINALRQGNTEIEIEKSSLQDEIYDIETCLEDFRDTLAEQKVLNANLRSEMEQRKKSERQLLQLSEERGLLLKEIHHRVKNNLQVITSMISLQKRTETEPKVLQSLSECQRRINNIATTHQFIYEGDLVSVNTRTFFAEIIATSLDALSDKSKQISISTDLEDHAICFDSALPCAQILGELLSNAFKHAFPEKQTGKIEVCFKQNRTGQLCLQVADNGIGFDADQKFDQSLGIRLIKALAQKLNGALTFENSEGSVVVLCFKEE